MNQKTRQVLWFYGVPVAAWSELKGSKLRWNFEYDQADLVDSCLTPEEFEGMVSKELHNLTTKIAKDHEILDIKKAITLAYEQNYPKEPV